MMNQSARRLCVAILLLLSTLTLVAACQPSTSAAPENADAAVATTASATSAPTVALTAEPTATQTTVSGTAVTADVLGDLTYGGILPGQQVTLTDGRADYEDAGGGQPFVRLVDQLIVTGDLNGDEAGDAAALLVDYTTGSADFVYLTAVLNVGTEPTPLEARLLGDRTPVKSVSIADTAVIVEFLAHAPTDADCCASLNTRKTFRLENGALVEVSSEELGTVSLDDLNGTRWQLVDLNEDREPVPAGVEITLSFEDGLLGGTAGCNTYRGSVSGERGVPHTFTAGPIASTSQACPDPIATLETVYLDRLARAVAWRYAFGNLAIMYQLEDASFGELLFVPQEP